MLLALVGPTASGKSEAAVVLAESLGGEILSCDSMLVYRGMDIGTAKPSAEQRARVRHHLIDVVGPSERFTISRYQAMAREALRGMKGRVLIVGGSGLYFRAVVDDLEFPGEDADVRRELERQAEVLGPARLYARLEEMDPVAANKIEPGNVRRIIRALEVGAITGQPFSRFSTAWGRHDSGRVRVAVVRMPSAVIDKRVRARVAWMLDAGWVDETQALTEAGFREWLTSTQAIGYTELARYLEGRLELDEAVELIVRRTKELARRQAAWFRREPRARWFDVGEGGAIEVIDAVRAYLEDG